MEKYVGSLEDMLQEVKKLSDSSETILKYKTRISALKNHLGISSTKYEDDPEELRNDLLGLRHRNVIENGPSDADQVIKYHENLQQKLTEEMLSLTRNLREQSEIANKIVKKDVEVVSRATELAQQNVNKLTVESGKLGEHSKKAWKCWMWLMIAVVLIVFINMVLFMKVMKKKY